jgi:hypothetical protein
MAAIFPIKMAMQGSRCQFFGRLSLDFNRIALSDPKSTLLACVHLLWKTTQLPPHLKQRGIGSDRPNYCLITSGVHVTNGRVAMALASPLSSGRIRPLRSKTISNASFRLTITTSRGRKLPNNRAAPR